MDKNLISTVLKALAVGMSVASVVLVFMGSVDVSTQVNLLGIGLVALSLVAFQSY